MSRSRDLAKQVQSIFASVDDATSEFARRAHLRCATGCGRCCETADASATVLEMLPMAWHLIDSGEAGEKLVEMTLDSERTDALTQNEKRCWLFGRSEAGRGRCREYANRPLVCRAFGYSARTAKTGAKEWLACSILKEKSVDASLAPGCEGFSLALAALDPELGTRLLPIHRALKLALEKVLHESALETAVETSIETPGGEG